MTSNLYFGVTAATVLAITGLLAHAFGALVQRRAPEIPVAVAGKASPVMSSTNGNRGERAVSALTAREQEVLRALATGSRSSEIADDLGIAERTVTAHLASIYQKLGGESRTAAVALSLQTGLVEGPSTG